MRESMTLERGVFLMFSKVLSACVFGVDGQVVEVEIDISNGLPVFQIVGLPDSSVRESQERVRAALKNCGFTFPLQRITVNLAPADLKKEGSAFDLAIAVGILLASKQIRVDYVDHTLLLGELALDGALRGVPGVLAMVQQAVSFGMKRVILPVDNAAEAALIRGVEVIPIAHLSQFNAAEAATIGAHPKRQPASSLLSDKRSKTTPMQAGRLTVVQDVHNEHHAAKAVGSVEDYSDVKGQYQVKRALTIAAAGMHNIIKSCSIFMLICLPYTKFPC